MLQNYIKIALRNLLQHKAFSTLNIAGLSIGMTCSIFILLWVSDELSYDKFHKRSESIYRVNISLLEMNTKAAMSSAPVAEAIQEQVPEAESVIRLSLDHFDLIQVGDKVFEEKHICYADSNFFEFFSFRMLEGDPATALKMPESILLTEDMAIKYFGTVKAVGKTIRKNNNNEDFIVTGVLANTPRNSHLQFDFVQPMSMLARTDRDLINRNWENFAWYTFVRMSDKFDASSKNLADLEIRIAEIFKKNSASTLKIKFDLQPMTSIHLTPGLLADVPGAGNIQYVYIFSVVGFFILAVACINFMNLATARSARRAKEVGLRKVVGAVRGQLIRQFLAESSVIAVVALMLALVFVSALLPSFNIISGKAIHLDILDNKLVFGLLWITLFTGVLGGSYPAFFLSRFTPAKVLKGELKSGSSGSLFRNTMVMIQFAVSITLLVGTAVIFDQMRFISNHDLGFDKENLIYFPINGDFGRDIGRLKTVLETDELTKDYGIVSDLPANIMNGTVNVKWEGKNPDAQPLFPNLAIDEHFIEVFHMTLLSGRGFSSEFKADQSNYIVNEKALEIMDMKVATAVGQKLSMWNEPGVIVGVVKNFNFKPVQSTIEPLIIRRNPGFGYIVVRAKPNQVESTIEKLKTVASTLNPQYPFSFGFVDKALDNLYQSEQRLSKLLTIFAALGIFISCLGLYGLSAFLAERRTKEIGVRKVLGASLGNLLYLLSKTFTRPIILAMVIATPISWYGMNQWLQGFTYHTTIDWKTFAAAFLVSIIIALATVSYETFKAARANPSKSLRSE